MLFVIGTAQYLSTNSSLIVLLSSSISFSIFLYSSFVLATKIAPMGQLLSQAQQLIHFLLSITKVFLSSSKVKAPVGHTPIPEHSGALSHILKLMRIDIIQI
jgi:hypothetical protein